jgi:hypothetical protein
MQSDSPRSSYKQRFGVTGVARNMQDSMTLPMRDIIFSSSFSLSSNGVQHPKGRNSGNCIQALVYYGSFIH